MKNSSSVWQRLVTAARQAPVQGDDVAPYGFSTRVAAMAMSVERPTMQAIVNRLSWRALGVALMLMVASIAANYSSLAAVGEGDQDPIDPVAEVLTTS